jgi:Carboxypeptidase regulatory-like domain
MNIKIKIIISAVILALMTGIVAAETQLIVNPTDADLVVQVGDMDNLGFGWPPGFDVFSGMSTPVHKYPFKPGAQDPPGTDTIMVGTSYNGSPPIGKDGYTGTTTRPANLPQAINMQYDLKGAQVNSATIQMFVDDFQSSVKKSKFQVTLNGQRAFFLEDVLNTLVQSGPVGKLITVRVPSDFLPMVRDGQLNISIDDPTTGAGDGFAIDFVRLLINSHITTMGNVSGIVTDNSTGLPLKGAVISTSGTVITETLSDGSYVLRGVPAGLVVLNASKRGYIPQSKSVDLVAGSNIILDFTLRPMPMANQNTVEPIITNFTPSRSTVIDLIGGPRTFTINVNQTVDVSWQIDGREVFSQTKVNTSSYSNISAAPGIWNISALAQNANGSDMQTWIWNVTQQIQASGVNAEREIKKQSLSQGESTNITIRINTNIIQALALKEVIPAGWNFTRISDDADDFRNSTNEWIWSNVTPGITKTVIYAITAPTDATIGTYYINGTIKNSSGIIAVVGGNNIITLELMPELDILAYYRGLGSDPDRVETTDLLKAMDDRRSKTVPAGFANPITNQELSVLINEWGDDII